MMEVCEETFRVTVMSTTFFLNEVRRRKIVENLSVLLNRWKDSCKGVQKPLLYLTFCIYLVMEMLFL